MKSSSLVYIRFNFREEILLWGLGLNSELCLLLYLSLLGLKKIYWVREMWVDKSGILLRENKTKVVTTISNYLNNLEGSRKADGELTNLCAYVIYAWYASQCHHHDSLPQSKSYLKIIDISYIQPSSNSITSEEITNFLSHTGLFENITLASKPRVIKASPKSDMAIVWIDIWDL